MQLKDSESEVKQLQSKFGELSDNYDNVKKSFETAQQVSSDCHLEL